MKLSRKRNKNKKNYKGFSKGRRKRLGKRKIEKD